MARKPTKDVINAAKKELNPLDLLNVIINEEKELKEALLNRGLVEEVKEGR